MPPETRAADRRCATPAPVRRRRRGSRRTRPPPRRSASPRVRVRTARTRGSWSLWSGVPLATSTPARGNDRRPSRWPQRLITVARPRFDGSTWVDYPAAGRRPGSDPDARAPNPPLLLRYVCEKRDEVVHELVVRARPGRVVVGVCPLAIDQGQVPLRDAGLAGQDRRRVQDPLSAEGGSERVDVEPLREVMAVGGLDVQDALRGVRVPLGDRAGVDGQAFRVVPRGAVEPLEPPPREHPGVAPDRGELAGLHPAAGIAACRQVAEMGLSGDEGGWRGLGV